MKNVLASKDLWKYCLYQNYNDYDKSFELSIEHDHVKRENIMSLIKTEKKSETTGATSTKVETPELAVREKVDTTSTSTVNTKAERKWRENDGKAAALISLSVSENYKKFTEVDSDEEPNSAYDIWARLKKKGNSMMQMCLINTNREYQALRMEGNETLLEYLARVELKIERLSDLGKRIPEADVVQHVLSTITEEYETITMSLLLIKPKHLTIAFLSQQFMLYQNMRGNE
jgi:hypothetical protein